MARPHNNEDLIDYKGEFDVPNVGASSTTNGDNFSQPLKLTPTAPNGMATMAPLMTGYEGKGSIMRPGRASFGP